MLHVILSPPARRRLARGTLLLLGCLVGATPALPQAPAASAGAPATQDRGAERAAFHQAYALAEQGGDGWRAMAGSLAGYPLYPYLEAASLEHDLHTLDRARVAAYLARYPDGIPARDLRRDFLLELARRQDWSDFLALYQPGMGDTLSCDALQARLAGAGSGNGAPFQLDFQRDLAALWDKPALPDACDGVLAQAQAQGLLTDTRLWSRIDHAAAAGKPGTIEQLAGWLPPDQATQAQRLAQAWSNPSAAVQAAAQWPDDTHSRQAAAVALTRLARRQSDAAETAWPSLSGHLHFDPTQRDDVLRALALYQATDYDTNALQRLIDLPASAQDDATREWRVRVALAGQDWSAVLAGIAAMPAEQRADGEWRYFQARALAALGRDAEARAAWSRLATEPTFFGFLAADRTQADYSLCPLDFGADPSAEDALLANPGLDRAFELFAVGLLPYARREWNAALNGADPSTVQHAADLAYRRGWYDRAVFVFSSGEALRYYTLRFPLASQDDVVAQAQQAGIDPAWAYGILRAESAWMSDARSGADARGLMQLLPVTAARVARLAGLAWAGGDSLYDPAINVALGTRYLAQLASRFTGAQWLATAAYNAGPAKVDQWLAARGTLPPDLFVATIPYKETREYVARVLAFAEIYDWRLHGDALPIDERLRALTTLVPAAQEPSRRAVRCAMPEPAATPAASASAAVPAMDASSGNPARDRRR